MKKTEDNLVELSRIIKRDEFESLEKRVKALESSLLSSGGETLSNSNRADHSACSYAQDAAMLFGCSVDPIDILVDPTKDGISGEFSLIQCPKAAIPTTQRIDSNKGPVFDFTRAYDFFDYARQNNILIKDGPYLDFQNPKYPVSMVPNELNNWIRERLVELNKIETPEYIDIISNFIGEDGDVLPCSVFKNTGIYGAMMMLSETISDFSPDSGIGITTKIKNFTKKKNLKSIESLVEIAENLLDNAIPLTYLGISLEINVDDEVNPEIVRENLKHIKSCDIPEVHFSGFIVTRGKKNFDDTGEGVYSDFLSAISEDDATSVFSVISPTTLSGYAQGPFTPDMKPTSTYDAIRKGFWRMTV